MKILSLFKHVFIPHEHNDYKPHFFREVSMLVIVVLSIFLLGFSAGSFFFIHKTVLGANVTASVLIDLTNESRLAFNQEPLIRNNLLDQAASLKAFNMVEEGYFAHNSPRGITPWYWMKEVGYSFLYAGENLAINFTDASEVRDAWLASPTHRANLLDIKFKEIGMATINGIYKDGPAIYVVQMFGTPAKAENASSLGISTTTSEVSGTSPTDVPSLPSEQDREEVVLNNPEIRGEMTTKAEETVEDYKEIMETEEFAVVQNQNAVEDIAATHEPSPEIPTYSTWYERFLFGGSYYVDLAYKFLIAFIVAALGLMVFIEVRRQHWRHIAYGLAMLLAITLCLLINQVFW